MLSSKISASELALLQAASKVMAKQVKPLCEEFYDYLDTQDHPQTSLLQRSFEQLLLNDHAAILDAISIDSFTTHKQLLSLFDHYLACMAARMPALLDNTEQANIALECLRRIAFDLIQQILDRQNTPLVQPHRKLSRKSDVVFEYAMSQSQFIMACNQFLVSEHTKDFAILAIQLDFGIHSNEILEPVLAEVALKLRQEIDQNDLIAHISTRRWAICLHNVNDPAPAIAKAKRLQAQFSNNLAINGIDTQVNAYIGIALASHVQKEADFLLQAAFKVSTMPAHRRERYQIYDPELDAESKRLDKLSADLKHAIENNALALYYQPKYSYKTKKIIGLETLLRWRNDERDIPVPVIFQLIERDNLLKDFTFWLLENTFKHLLDFLERGIDIQLSVNILPQNLNEPDFIHMMSGLLDQWHIPRDRLTIEITEGSLLDDADETIEVLRAIRKLGLRISLDDFGTGYSSLSYLSRLPINEIKVDQAFVKNLFQSDRDLAIIRTIIELGNNFHLDLVAEGVEDEATAERLAALGCDTLQGFWISKPLSQAELISWFTHDDRQVWQHSG